MKDLLSSFNAYIKTEGLLKPKQKVLLAISGGMDSIVLLDLLHRSTIPFELAHVNFQLRGEESTRDEQFVRELAKSYQVNLHVKHVDTEINASEHKLSIQEAARKIRYDWFDELLKQHQLDVVCTAHHADDNVETMLMNLFRGTGLTGLRGMLPKQGKIIRPLLFASRETIQEYSAQQELKHVEDSSNASEKYTRNFLRLQIIPQLSKVWPEVAETLRQNMQRFSETEMVYQEALQRKLKKLITIKEDEWHVPVEKLRLTAPLRTIVFELFQDKGFSSKQVDEIIHLLDASTGSYIDSTTHRILKNRNWLICTPLKKENTFIHIIEPEHQSLILTQGEIHFKQKEWSPKERVSDRPETIELDLAAIQYPLILRNWKAGDYFYPLGMQKKKKIARFLIDQKLSKIEKEQVLVLESAGRICWVVGHRIDDRFKVRKATKRVLVVSLKK